MILGLAPELPEWRNACDRVVLACQKFLEFDNKTAGVCGSTEVLRNLVKPGKFGNGNSKFLGTFWAIKFFQKGLVMYFLQGHSLGDEESVAHDILFEHYLEIHGGLR